jgi:DNA polymerase-3 subunit delta
LKIPHRQLAAQLKTGVAPVYLVAGEEPLLVAEALEQIREAAKRAGFAERELHVADRGFRWSELESQSDNLSLFAMQKIVELRLQSPRLGDAGSKTVKALIEKRDPDRLLLLGVMAKLEADVARTAWVKAVEKEGVRVEIWPIGRAELPRWISARAAKYHVRLTPPAVELLADRAEGNLLAADQELVKLGLTHAGATVDEAAILEAVSDSSRFDVFALSDAVLAGDAVRALKILAGLKAEGAQPALICWSLSRDFGLLTKLTFAAAGGGLDGAFRQCGVWPRRQPLVKAALRRLGPKQWSALLVRAAQLDQLVKGIGTGSAWDAITDIVMRAVGPVRRVAVR